MNANPAGLNQDATQQSPNQDLCEAIERDYPHLRQALVPVVRSFLKGKSSQYVSQRTDEVLSATLLEAMKNSHSFKSGQPVIPWIIGIAKNVLKGQAREEGKHRCVELGDMGWDSLLGILDPSDGTETARADVHDWLARLPEPARQVLECRFLRELTGQELAEAIGAPSEGAARVRVARALQALKRLIPPEVSR